MNEIQQSMSTAYHSESDSQTKIANKAILTILKAKLFNQGGAWLLQLPHVVNAINSTIDASRGCTPHTMVLTFNSMYQNSLRVSNLANNRPEGLRHDLWSGM